MSESPAIVQSPGGSNRRLGPHEVPRIECGKCGTSHHYDAAAGEYLGRCRECSAFLRRPTEEEHQQFTDFLVWNSQHLDLENEQTQLVTDGGEEVTDAIEQIPEDVDEFNERVTESVREWVLDQHPGKETQKELLREHAHHLVRDTESAYSRDHDSPDGVQIDSTAYVEDTYCFTCGEWVGLSGVDLRGTPRSRADAYYLGGPPEDVREARAEIRDRLGDLAEHALLNVEHVEDPEDAFAFVGEQHEQLTERASEVADGGE